MRLDRLLAITVTLLNYNKISAGALASRFGVSVRTVYRDMDAINSAGIPIISYPGSSGGFGIMDTFKMDRQVLTLNDMLSILRALKGISSAVEDSGINTAMEKIKSLVPDDKSDYLEEQLQHIVVDLTPWDTNGRYKQLTAMLYPAISQSKLVRLSYRNLKGEKSLRLIEPMTLVNKNFSWYLFAFCRERNDFRLFKLRRMIDAVVTEEKFVRKQVSFSEYFDRQKPEKELTQVILSFKPEVRFKAEEYFPAENLIYNEDGSVIADLLMPLDEWVYGMILSLGEGAEVISPSSVREKIQIKLKKMLSLYKHDILVS